MGKLKWGLKAAAEEMDDQGFYDGAVPPKGRYICAVKRLRVTETQNGDPRFNGLLEIRDPRKGKSQYNGYAFWMGINITPKSVKFVTNFIKQGLAVPFKDLSDLDRILDVDGKAGDYPLNVNAIGRIKFNVDGKEPLIVVNAKRRRQNDDPEGDWELTTDDWAPAFPGIDPKKLAAESDVDDEDEDDEDDAADDMFEDDEDDDDDEEVDEDDEEADDEDEDEEGEEEEPLTREELQEMPLPELRELAAETGVMTKVRAKKAGRAALVDALAPEDEPEDEDEDEQEEEEEEAPPPRKAAKRTAAKKAPAKATRRR
jgi:hypothetical protein